MHDIKEGEGFGILTNIIHWEWAGVSTQDHKKTKRIITQKLRDHMSEVTVSRMVSQHRQLSDESSIINRL